MNHSRDHIDSIVRVRTEGPAALVTFHVAEPGPGLAPRLQRALAGVLQRLLGEDEPARVVILAGAGADFCDDADLAETDEPANAASPAQWRERCAAATRLARTLWTADKPLLAAVEGRCSGLGLALVAGCDIAVGARDSNYTCNHLAAGVVPDTGLMWTLQHKLGAAKAGELMLTGATIDGLQAHRLGLLSMAVEPGQALAAALEQAERLARLPPVTLALMKSALLNGMNSIPDAWRHEVDLNPLVRMTQDHHEAVAAFMEKRPARFSGT